MAAAVVELDALPDAVRSAAENHDLVLRVRIGFAGWLVRAVQIRRERFELGGASIDTLVDRSEFERRPFPSNRFFRRLEGERQFLIAKACSLEAPQRIAC